MEWPRPPLRVSPSIKVFKSRLKALLCISKHSPYSVHNNASSLNQSRMRMGLRLNAHRHKYGFVPNSHCRFCQVPNEDPIHFFLACTQYAAPRQTLFNRIRPHIAGDLERLSNPQVLFRIMRKYSSISNRNFLVWIRYMYYRFQ